jgi:hypothetical protein
MALVAMQRLCLILTLLACAPVLGCERRKRDRGGARKQDASMTTSKKVPSAEVIALRDEVIAKTVILDRPEYTPKDPELYDASIQSALYWHGNDPSKRAAVIDSAANSARIRLPRGEPGRSVIEKLINARYHAPVITRAGDLVHIDLAMIAGTLGDSRHGMAMTSPLEDRGGGLVVPEVIRNLKAGITAQPGAKTYQVEVDIPSRYVKEWTYVYDVPEDVVRVFRKDTSGEVGVTGRLGGGLYQITSLHWVWLRREELRFHSPRPKDARGKER